MTPAQLAMLVSFFGPVVIDSLIAKFPTKHWAADLAGRIAKTSELSFRRNDVRALKLALDKDGWTAIVDAARGDRAGLQRLASTSIPTATGIQVEGLAADIEAEAARSLSPVDYQALLDLRMRLLQESLVAIQNSDATSLSGAMGVDAYVSMVGATARLRRWRLRRSAGLNETQIAASFSIDVPRVHDLEHLARGSILFVTAPIGSGKSDVLLDWIARSADHARIDQRAPVPVLLRADEVVGRLQDVVLTQVPVATLQERGVDIVLDGLDEVGRRSRSLAESAIEFVESWARSRIVVSARNSAVPSGVPHVSLTQWTLDRSQELVSAVTDGPSPAVRHWSEYLQESITRPLFALLAAQMPIGAGPYDMVNSLVRKSILTADHAAHRDLAIAIIRADAAVDPHTLPSIEAAHFVDDRLVNTSSKLWRFELPIYLQWFAAQGIIGGIVPISETTRSIEAFSQWRYVLAVALAGAEPEKVDSILGEISRWNPGAASWLIKEVESAALGTTVAPSASESSAIGRLLKAFRALSVSGVEPYPGRLVPDAVTLAVDVRDARVTVQWRSRRPGEDEVSPMLAYDASWEGVLWGTTQMDRTTDQASWPWELALSVLTDDLEKSLEHPHLLGRTGSILRLEFAHTAWSKIERARMTIDDVLTFNGAKSVPALANVNGLVIDHATLITLDEERVGWSHDGPWAAPDLKTYRSSWVGGNYSDEQLEVRVREVYEAAIAAYLELSEGVFSQFGDLLGFRAGLPGSFIGHVVPAGENNAGISSYFLPAPSRKDELDAFKVLIDVNPARMGPSKIEMIEMENAYRARIRNVPDTRLMLGRSYSMSVLDVFGTRPATGLALKWIGSDLGRLGRLPSHFRGLR